MFYVYLLQSKKQNYTYIGSTPDLKRRLKEHNQNMVRSTKPYTPFNLVYYEAFSEEKLARQREKRLKCYGSAYYELLKRLRGIEKI